MGAPLRFASRDRVTFSQRLALDRSGRSYDSDGRMRVATSVLTAACVSPYAGAEVPNGDELGLDPGRIYNILRPIEELKRALPLFNSMPLLSEHIPVSADDHRPDLVIGSTGSDARIVGNTVINSLVIWAKSGIDLVESGAAKALSCGYKYRAIARSGNFGGVPYTLVMADIEPNHLIICPQGRVPQALVGDSSSSIKPRKGRRMATDADGNDDDSARERLLDYLARSGLSGKAMLAVIAILDGEDPDGDEQDDATADPEIAADRARQVGDAHRRVQRKRMAADAAAQTEREKRFPNHARLR